MRGVVDNSYHKSSCLNLSYQHIHSCFRLTFEDPFDAHLKSTPAMHVNFDLASLSSALGGKELVWVWVAF